MTVRPAARHALAQAGLALASDASVRAREGVGTPAGLEDEITSAMAAWRVPGVAAAAIRDGRVVLRQGYGRREHPRGQRVTPRTVFAIGSCTKAFTATAVGMLVDEGKVDLDAPVIRYLPGFRLFDDRATLRVTPRDLLTHRTGLPAYDRLWLLQALSRQELVDRLRFLEPNRAPRRAFQYSNLGYLAVGAVIERVSGLAWEDFVQRRIFAPLGMRDSNTSVDASRRAADHASPHREVDGEPTAIPFRNVDALGPASAINASLDDMVRWLQLQLRGGRFDGNRLISAATLREIHRAQVALHDPAVTRLTLASSYGLGWYVSRHRRHRLAEHAGGVDGFTAVVGLLPDDGIGVVVLANTHPTMLPQALARRLYDRLLGLPPRDWHGRLAEALTAYLHPPIPEAGAGDRPAPAAPQRWARLEGSYAHPAFGTLDLRLEGERLLGGFFGDEVILEPTPDGDFVIRGSALEGMRVRPGVDPRDGLATLALPLEPRAADVTFRRIGLPPGAAGP